MNIVILNGSPAGKDSITLCTMLYIEKHFPEHSYEILNVGQQIKKMEKDPDSWMPVLRSADLIVFCYPIYTFLAPSQLHRFIELMKECGIDFSGRYATQVTTSKHFYDITAHRYISDNRADMKMKYIRGLSADMEDLLREQGQKEALDFFRYVLWNMEKGFSEPDPAPAGAFTPVPVGPAPEKAGITAPGKIIIVADYSHSEDHLLEDMCGYLKNILPCEAEIINIEDFPFAGGCLGCFRCASDGKCVYKDGFDSYLREHIQTADGLVYAYTIKDHSMGYRFKIFDDRQFCNGHRTVTMGRPVAYLVDGPLDSEENLRVLMESRAQVGGNTLAGIATNQRDPAGEIRQLAETLRYDISEHYQPPKNFYGVGGLKIFRDLIWQMQGLMREDHRFYKKHGFYDFPQKRRGTMMAMYLVGGIMRSKKLSRKLGNRMSEGMMMPYSKVLGEKAGRKK